jgi:hypothetical protein
MASRSSRLALLALFVVLIVAAALFPEQGVPLPSLEKRWSIGVYAGESPLALMPGAADPVFTADRVRDIRARFVADPFLVHDGGAWHLFFEAFNAVTSQGDIGWATSPDARQWTYQRIVLDEPFRLAYPYVFRADDAYYMVPDNGDGAVRLYRAEPFPIRWRFVAELVRGGAVIDPSLVYHERRWWMFAGAPGNAALYAYYADRLEGPWQPHVANPIVATAPDHARPGGRIVSWNDRLIRFGQNDAATYGEGVSAFEITTLTPDRFEERPAEPRTALSASGRGWNSTGMHHVDAQEIAPGSWIAAVDGSERVLMFGVRRLWPWRGGN